MIKGYKDIEKRLNIAKELKKYRIDPMRQLLKLLGRNDNNFITDDFARYSQAYYFFYLSLTRLFHEMLIGARWRSGPYFALKYRIKYTASQVKLAKKYNSISKYLEYDFMNSILHARILMDKAIGIAKYFIINNKMPSFTSFDNHKKFFLKLKRRNEKYGEFEDYANYIREKTDWFDIPLKIVRDKFLVHSGQKHMKILGYPFGGNELNLKIFFNDLNEEGPLLKEVNGISLSIPQLANDIRNFLIWFAKYGVNKLKKYNILMNKDPENQLQPNLGKWDLKKVIIFKN